jgi:uncharacterized metal-binding protein
MPNLPRRKAGIVACSGEELAEGTVSRLAALKVLHELRPNDTVTICLPLFLAGGAGDRAFARFHPTITVDGCELRCAARATEMYSAKPSASIVVNELLAEQGLAKPAGCRRLNQAGERAVHAVAERLTTLVDQVLDKQGRPANAIEAAATAAPPEQAMSTCSCGSDIPIQKTVVAGQVVGIVALPLILQQVREAGRGPDEAVAGELLDAVKIYNFVPPAAEPDYRVALLREYAAFCEQEHAR